MKLEVAMPTGRRPRGSKAAAVALRARDAEDRKEDERRWNRIFDDLTNRPGLERAQAEAIVRTAQTLDTATDERKKELRRLLDARFGPSEPVPTPPQAPEPLEAPSPPPPPPRAQQEAPRRPSPRAKAQLRLFPEEPVLADEEPLERPSKPPRTRKERPAEPRDEAEVENRFRYLVLRMGFDAAQALISDLKRRCGLA